MGCRSEEDQRAQREPLCVGSVQWHLRQPRLWRTVPSGRESNLWEMSQVLQHLSLLWPSSPPLQAFLVSIAHLYVQQVLATQEYHLHFDGWWLLNYSRSLIQFAGYSEILRRRRLQSRVLSQRSLRVHRTS